MALLTSHLAAADPHSQYAKTTDLATKADLVYGTVPSSQLPALVVTDVFTVSSQSAQLALTAQKGDIAIRADLSKSFAHNGGSAGTMADWSELVSPSDAVTSVNGLIGNVTLGYANVGAAAASHTHSKSAISDLETITTTPTAGAIPKGDGGGKLANGWLNTGSGHGLDADKVDGFEATALAKLAAADFVGAVTVTVPGDTDTPLSLHVPSTASGSAVFFQARNGGSAGTGGTLLARLFSGGTFDAQRVRAVATGTVTACAIARSSDDNTGFNFPAADTLDVVTNGSTRATFDSSGRIGIGRTPTTSTLEVAGDIQTYSGKILSASVIRPGSFTVSSLPTTGISAGATAYASNGRKSGEGSGSGSGIPVWYDGTNWRTYFDNSVAAA